MAAIFILPRPTPSLYFHYSSSSSLPKYHQVFRCSVMQSPLLKGWNPGFYSKEKFKPLTSTTSTEWRRRRRTLICAVNQDAEKAFKKTVEVDRLIDMLREATPNELQQLVVENILAFNENFWIRLAARSDTCKSDDDKKDYEELASAVMSIVDCLVHKTHAQEDCDKPGLEAMLQKVLQLYASTVLSKRSYAKKGNEVLKAEQFLETVIKAPEQEWNKLLIDGLTVGKGEISPEDFNAVIKKRIERTLIRTEGGSYRQRILTEYLKGIQSRAEEIVQLLQGNAE
ncbi:Uncharacterized protein TCM_006810 isoform 2 [Theobroma cacao]|uniref:Uncharacterized protein isoform 2 n=1 Tax=Theobroma cacao TaxID=3641 RepID=A0A061E6J3_THECC|nr:Uncharacterized protein TCM_006810 isoform 2 [Theobroma cacao]